jgi:hypothetical protein
MKKPMRLRITRDEAPDLADDPRLRELLAATLYTLVETAMLHDIDPAAYLHAAIVAGDRGELLLPWTMPRPESRGNLDEQS